MQVDDRPADSVDAPDHTDARADASTIPEPIESRGAPIAGLRHQAHGDTQICVRTLALLSRTYHVTLPVLLASMKRAGLRQARLVVPQEESAPTYIAIGGLKVGLDVFEAPVDRKRVDAAVAQSNLDEADADAVRDHAAHIAIDVAYDQQTARADAVMIAMRAQAGLMEFAPVVAVVWPEAAKVITATDATRYVEAAMSDAGVVTEACASERRFELDGPNAGLLLFDSLGLGAFGLPDAQVVVAETFASQGVDALRELMRHFLLHGCDLPDGGGYRLDDGTNWRVTYTRSAFDPDREVVQVRPDSDAPTDRAE
jgi:hypothetical protein